MANNNLKVLLDVFITDAVGGNEPRGQATRHDIAASDLVEMYLDAYTDPDHCMGKTPGAAAVLAQIGRRYLSTFNDTKLHDEFFQELRKVPIWNENGENGYDPVCINFNSKACWTALGAAVIYCGLMPETIPADLLGAWYRAALESKEIRPEEWYFYHDFAEFGRAMHDHYRLHCEYGHIAENLLICRDVSPLHDIEYAALTEALVYSVCGYKGALLAEQKEKRKEALKEAAYAYADAVSEASERCSFRGGKRPPVQVGYAQKIVGVASLYPASVRKEF